MAYVCPVCDERAPDGEHLAHHLAIVAMARGGEHEAWLDEHVAGWQTAEPATVAETAIEHAEEVEDDLDDGEGGERPDVGHAHAGQYHAQGHDHADGTDHAHGHEHADGRGRGGAGGTGDAVPTGDLDDRAASVLAEARELTAKRLADSSEDDGEAAGSADSGDDGSETDSDE